MEQSNSLDLLLRDGYALRNSPQVPTTCTSPFLPSEASKNTWGQLPKLLLLDRSLLECLIKWVLNPLVRFSNTYIVDLPILGRGICRLEWDECSLFIDQYVWQFCLTFLEIRTLYNRELQELWKCKEQLCRIETGLNKISTTQMQLFHCCYCIQCFTYFSAFMQNSI